MMTDFLILLVGEAADCNNDASVETVFNVACIDHVWSLMIPSHQFNLHSFNVPACLIVD